MFANTPYRYWKCQLLGWSLAASYWAYGAYFIHDYSVFYTIINFLLDVVIGVSLTHLYKLIANRRGRTLSMKGGFFIPIIAIIVLSILFMLLNNIKWFLYWQAIQGRSTDFMESLFHWDPPLITGLRLMSIWVLLYHIYHYHKQQIKLTADNAELSVLAKQVQLDHLSNQLKPHFLFNSLNSVKSLISENPFKAKRSIDLLSDILRSSIYAKEGLICIQDELQLIYDYVELEKLRFEERLQLAVNVDDDVLTYKVPSLCIQTLIENALKHGIQNSIKGGVIGLCISKNSEYIGIVVQNPGSLNMQDGVGDSSMGLENLRKRLYLQYKEKAKFTLVEKPLGYVTGTIMIPLI